MMKPRVLGLGLWALGILLAGCAGYRLGPTNHLPPASRSIQVNLFHNQTPEPRLSAALAGALRQALQQDGTYQLRTDGGADIIVSGEIIRYDRGILTFEPSDTLTARDISASMTAHVQARDRLSGKVFLDRDATGRSTVRVGNDLPSAERQALPLLAEDLARIITDQLVEGIW